MTMSTLMYPGKVALDRLGNVWVSDHANEGRGNHRLLMYPATLFPTDGGSVVFAPEATKAITNVSTYEVAFDSQNRMAVTYSLYAYGGPQGGRFVAIYTDPLGPSTTPDFLLADYGSFTPAWFDDDDNLYVGDGMRPRVLIYKNPFSSTPSPTSTPTPSPTPTPTPTPTATPLIDFDTQAPVVTITSPTDGVTVSGTVNITATATDNVGVVKMEVYIDGELARISTTSTISYRWNTRPKKVAVGLHRIEVKARDLAGNTGSASITVTKP